ncbi:hypothetical protein, partial [Paenibacillus typhae]|uniref:hypothetical protein n=1 Tax=Paenibacillus typhae TaxID=1174501 RepID=UPI0039EF6917
MGFRPLLRLDFLIEAAVQRSKSNLKGGRYRSCSSKIPSVTLTRPVFACLFSRPLCCAACLLHGSIAGALAYPVLRLPDNSIVSADRGKRPRAKDNSKSQDQRPRTKGKTQNPKPKTQR